MKKSKPLSILVKLAVTLGILITIAGCDLLMIDILKESVDEQTGTVSITYHPNGASSGECPQDDTAYRKTDTAVIADNTGNLGISGYTFTGWNTQTDGSGQDYYPSDEIVLSSEDLMLYAQWRADEQILSFNANGGRGSMSPLTLETDEEITLPAITFTKDGYNFSGWSESSDGSADYTDEATFVMNPADTTLYAQWAADSDTQYTVEHWQQDVSGSSYTKIETATLTGSTGSTATATGNSYPGFSENITHSARIASGEIAGDGSLVLKLYYDRETYTVSFAENGGTSVSDLTGVRYGAMVSKPTITRAGYTFGGWYADSGLTEAWIFTSDTVTETKMLYAKWSADSHTLSFNANGGNGSMSPLTLETDEEITLPANTFTKDGYNFSGWSETSGGTVDFTDGASYTMNPDDTTLYAVWAADSDTQYTVEHWQQDVSGSSYTKIETATQTGSTGSTATATGNSYPGFSENMTHSARIASGEIAGDGSLVLKIYYDRDTYTVSFAENGGSRVSDITGVRYGAMVSKPTVTRVGYTFGGWYADSGLTEAWSFTSDTVTETTRLYAQWTADSDTQYTVEHWQQGVSGSSYTKIETATLTGSTGSTATANPKSYTGFSENTSHADRVSSGTIAGDGSLVLKLYYDRETFTVSFAENGGSSVSDLTGVRYGAMVSKPTITRAGYTFGGWYADSGLTEAWSFTSDTVTETKRLYASWSANSHTLSFHANDGSGMMNSQTVKTDEEITLRSNSFTREGYSFAGWAESSGGSTVYADEASYTMGTADAGLCAVWSAHTDTPYTVEHYQQDVSGSGYTKVTADTESLSGTTGTTAAASPKSYTGFSENTGHADRIASGTITGDGSLVLKLYYDWDTFTVSFASNGGSSVSSITGVRYGTTVSEPTKPTRAGYTFDGWYADSGLTEAWSFTSDTVTETKRLYASWSADSHTLSFHANGGSGTMDPQTVKTDEEITLRGNSFTREGYSFAGWAESSGGSTVYADEASYTMGTADAGLYAVWIPYGVGINGPAGGWIFYDKGSYSDGWRYLEAAPYGWYDGGDDPRVQWGGNGTTVGGTSTAVGTGEANTEAIVAKLGAGTYAAKACAEYSTTVNGVVYDDWFLPSKDELNLIYENLHLQGLGELSSDFYWSSSELSSYYAWFQYFSNGHQSYNVKNYEFRVLRVRAVRSF